MSLGIIARAESGGLSALCWDVWRHLRPERTLVVHTRHTTRGLSDPSRFQGIGQMRSCPNAPSQADAAWLLDGVDTVWTAETWYSHDVPRMAQARGVRTVLYAMPEMHGREMADETYVPTDWRMDLVPGASVLPFPVARDVLPFRQRTEARTFYHVAGAAMEDRNGTQNVMAAIERMREPARFLIRGAGTGRRRIGHVDVEWLPDHPGIYHEAWAQVSEADVLVMPRRFGGLCLERGTLVETPQGRVVIEDLRRGSIVADEQGWTRVTATAERRVDETVAITARGRRLVSSEDHLHLVADFHDAPLRETKARDVVPGDWMLLVQPSPDGIRRVEVGPRPVKRQGLVNWWPSIELDDGWARMVGLWLAEGFGGLYRRPGRDRPLAEVKWTFGPDEQTFADEVVGLLAERGIHARAYLSKPGPGTFGPGRCWIVRCRSLWLYEMFEALGLGHGAWHKRVPDVHADLVPALVGGWLDGDGCINRPGALSGFSRSVEMIQGMLHLLAKRGIPATVTKDGQQVGIGERSAVAEVCTWTKRLRTSPEYVRPPRPHRTSRAHEHGWLVRVQAVERRAEAADVVAIETESGHYVANDLLTHNCLPLQEAVSLGMPVVLLDTDPYAKAAGGFVVIPACYCNEVSMKGGRVHVMGCDPEQLAAALDVLACSPETVAGLSQRQDAYAISWGAALATWEAILRP